MLITSADSRIRVVDGLNLVHKYKGIKFESGNFSKSWRLVILDLFLRHSSVLLQCLSLFLRSDL